MENETDLRTDKRYLEKQLDGAKDYLAELKNTVESIRADIEDKKYDLSIRESAAARWTKYVEQIESQLEEIMINE